MSGSVECSDCKFWRGPTGNTKGQDMQFGTCHRHAPSALPWAAMHFWTHHKGKIEPSDSSAAWPFVWEHDWCGEYEGK